MTCLTETPLLCVSLPARQNAIWSFLPEHLVSQKYNVVAANMELWNNVYNNDDCAVVITFSWCLMMLQVWMATETTARSRLYSMLSHAPAVLVTNNSTAYCLLLIFCTAVNVASLCATKCSNIYSALEVQLSSDSQNILSQPKAYISIAIRLRYDYDTTIPRRIRQFRLRRKWSKLWFDCDTTTTRLRQDYDEKLTLFFARVEWKQARANVVVGS